jgi:hypothetical protein
LCIPVQVLVYRVTSGGAPAKSSTLASTLTSTAAASATAAVQSATQLSVEEVLALLAISDQQGLEVRRQHLLYVYYMLLHALLLTVAVHIAV